MGRRSGLAALMAAALLGGGCGESDGDRAVMAVRDFLGALERHDGAAACEGLAEAGVSELLLAALRAGVPGSGLDEPSVDRCATIARRLSRETAELRELRESPITRRLLIGRRATIETRAGAYELERVDGRWRVSRFEPAARVLAGGDASERPVGLVLVTPELSEPALGPAVSGSTRRSAIELTGTLEPPDARLRVMASPRSLVTRADARDGRFLVALELSRGRNEVVLTAEAPGHTRAELTVRITRR